MLSSSIIDVEGMGYAVVSESNTSLHPNGKALFIAERTEALLSVR